MTNEQKLLQVTAKIKELLTTLDKVDETNGSILYKEKARTQRRELKVWLAGNQNITPVPAKKQAYTNRKSPNKLNHNQSWLAQ